MSNRTKNWPIAQFQLPNIHRGHFEVKVQFFLRAQSSSIDKLPKKKKNKPLDQTRTKHNLHKMHCEILGGWSFSHFFDFMTFN